MNEPTTLVEVSGLAMRYGPVTALDGVDLTLASGQIVGLLGENGCGKTTLLKILAGVMTGYSGDVASQVTSPVRSRRLECPSCPTPASFPTARGSVTAWTCKRTSSPTSAPRRPATSSVSSD